MQKIRWNVYRNIPSQEETKKVFDFVSSMGFVDDAEIVKKEKTVQTECFKRRIRNFFSNFLAGLEIGFYAKEISMLDFYGEETYIYTQRTIRFKSRNQIPLILITEETYLYGEIACGKVIWSSNHITNFFKRILK